MSYARVSLVYFLRLLLSFSSLFAPARLRLRLALLRLLLYFSSLFARLAFGCTSHFFLEQTKRAARRLVVEREQAGGGPAPTGSHAGRGRPPAHRSAARHPARR